MLENANIPRGGFFSYSDEPSNRWNDLLREIKQGGADSVCVPIRWGAHEQLRGSRDFAKAPRLRLEKFLQSVHEAGLAAEIVVGFPPGPESLPSWTTAVKTVTLVPAACEGHPDLELISVPSLYDPTLSQAFREFIEETASILALYTSPQGAVMSVSFDFGGYEFDQCAVDSSAYITGLQERYATIQELNSIYASAFRGFETVTTRQGIRTMNDRRAWLAAFDYKFCRRRTLDAFRSELRSLESVKQITSRQPLRSSPDPKPRSRPHLQIAFEPVLIETGVGAKRMGFPFSPAGYLSESATNAFRLFEYLQENVSRAEDASFEILPLWETRALPSASLTVVINGKYLARAAYDSLGLMLDEGAVLLFPLGLPQYDEKMRTYDWGKVGSGKAIVSSGRSLCRAQKGKGEVWYASPPLGFSDALWDELQCLVGALPAAEGKA